MNKLFLHTAMFRVLSPVFSGVVTYLLILLLDNNFEQLQEQFFGQELYVCIAISYIIHEFSRLLLKTTTIIPKFSKMIITLLFQCIISVLLVVLVVYGLINSYYLFILKYAPLTEEILPFLYIYASIPLAFVLLHFSHQYLYKINTQKLENELLIKENIEEEFKQFKREINPELLFESFEALLVFIKEDKEKVDDFVDYLATIYRYILSSKNNQLFSFQQEVVVLQEFVKLYNSLPYRKVNVSVSEEKDFLIVPGTLLFIVEQIIKTTIRSSYSKLEIEVTVTGARFEINYVSDEKLKYKFSEKSIEEIVRVYQIYSASKIIFEHDNEIRKIAIPKLEFES